MLNFQGLLPYEGDENAVPLGVNKAQHVQLSLLI